MVFVIFQSSTNSLSCYAVLWSALSLEVARASSPKPPSFQLVQRLDHELSLVRRLNGILSSYVVWINIDLSMSTRWLVLIRDIFAERT